jgi:hypothetical protein
MPRLNICEKSRFWTKNDCIHWSIYWSRIVEENTIKIYENRKHDFLATIELILRWMLVHTSIYLTYCWYQTMLFICKSSWFLFIRKYIVWVFLAFQQAFIYTGLYFSYSIDFWKSIDLLISECIIISVPMKQHKFNAYPSNQTKNISQMGKYCIIITSGTERLI